MNRADDEEYLIFRAQGGSIPISERSARLTGLRFTVWRPGLLNTRPTGQPLQLVSWWGLHQARVFTNRQYSLLLARDGERIVHRSCIAPTWFRWPFMAADDIQITSTWTEPDYRGRGIATFAAQLIVARANPDQTVWYATRKRNESSLAVCRAAGMEYAGTAIRTQRLGLRILGSLVIG